MQEDLKHIELFDQYISDELEISDRSAFEKKLKSENDFAKEFSFYQKMLKGIEAVNVEEVKQNIQSVEEEFKLSGFFLDEVDIDEYLQGTSNVTQDALIEKRIQTDNDFAEKVKFEKSMLQGIKSNDLSDLEKTIAETQSKLETEDFFKEGKIVKLPVVESKPKEKQIPVVSMWRKYASVAAAVLLLTVIWIVMSLNSEVTKQGLANSFADNSLEIPTQLKGEPTSTQHDIYKGWEKAINDYENNNKENTNSFFQSADPSNLEAQDTASFFYNLAILEISNGNYKKADTIFKRIEKTNPSKIAWQRSLILLYQEKPKEEIMAAFTKIANSSNFPGQMRKKAKSVLEELTKVEE